MFFGNEFNMYAPKDFKLIVIIDFPLKQTQNFEAIKGNCLSSIIIYNSQEAPCIIFFSFVLFYSKYSESTDHRA